MLKTDFLKNMLIYRFDGCSALELGGGVGLCSIVLGRVAQRVLCTGTVYFLPLYTVAVIYVSILSFLLQHVSKRMIMFSHSALNWDSLIKKTKLCKNIPLNYIKTQFSKVD